MTASRPTSAGRRPPPIARSDPEPFAPGPTRPIGSSGRRPLTPHPSQIGGSRLLSNDHDQLVALGWDDWFSDRFAQLSPGDRLAPARVVADHGVGRVVHTGTETIDAQ